MPYKNIEDKRRHSREWIRNKRKKTNNKYDKEYRKSNRVKCIERTVRWQRKNRKRFLDYHKSYYRKNKVKRIAYGRAWGQQNPDKLRIKSSKRRTAKTKAGGSFTVEQWKILCNKHDSKCLCCGKKKKLTADHVIPVSKGGTSNIDNIQPLCLSCNSKKGTKIIDFRKKGKHK